jgi:peptidoglycan DL-endopeptidase CwlO
LGVISAMLVAAATAIPAGATTLAQKQAQAKSAEAQLTQLQNAAEAKIEAYDRVHQRYQTTLAALHRTTQTLALARKNLHAAQEQLAASLMADYKSGNQSAIAYVLAARSIGDLVDQVQVLQRTTGVNKTLLGTITRFHRVVVSREALLNKQRTQVAHEQSAARAEANAAKASVARERNYFNGLKASIRRTINEEQAAAARTAAEQAGQGGRTTSSPPPGNLPNPPAGTLGGQAVAIAERYLGVPYVWGGASPSGFDCSGLTMYVYGQLGVSLPHNAAAQYDSLPHVSESDLQPGDLVFFDGLNHVGMYIGGGEIIHAPHTGTVVQIAPLSGGGSYFGAARVPG